MKTILLTTILACSGIISAQTPAFVSDWEGAPDKFKIRNNNNSEYEVVFTEEKPLAETKPIRDEIAKKAEQTSVSDCKEPVHFLGNR
jgi:hypothetical protein